MRKIPCLKCKRVRWARTVPGFLLQKGVEPRAAQKMCLPCQRKAFR